VLIAITRGLMKAANKLKENAKPQPAEWIRERILAFSDAWRRKDVEELMSYISDDCIYGASVGPEPGTTYVGRDECRRGFEELIKYDEKSEARGGRVYVAENACVAEWSFVSRDESGNEIEVRGCDIFEFAGDKVCRKDAFRKTYPQSPAKI
jgi:hypothetical protein